MLSRSLGASGFFPSPQSKWMKKPSLSSLKVSEQAFWQVKNELRGFKLCVGAFDSGISELRLPISTLDTPSSVFGEKNMKNEPSRTVNKMLTTEKNI